MVYRYSKNREERNSLATTNATYIFKDTGNIEIWLIVTDSLNRVDTFKQIVRVKPVSGKLNIDNVCLNKASTFNIIGLSPKDYSVSWYIDEVFYNFKDTLVFSKLTEKSYQVRAAIQSTIENCEYYLDSFLVTSIAPTISKIHIADSCIGDQKSPLNKKRRQINHLRVRSSLISSRWKPCTFSGDWRNW